MCFNDRVTFQEHKLGIRQDSNFIIFNLAFGLLGLQEIQDHLILDKLVALFTDRQVELLLAFLKILLSSNQPSQPCLNAARPKTICIRGSSHAGKIILLLKPITEQCLLARLLAVESVKLAPNAVLPHDHVEVRHAVLLFQTEDYMIDKICVPTENGFSQRLCSLLQFEEKRHLPVSANLVLEQLDRQLPLPALDGLLGNVAVRDVRRETEPGAHLPSCLRLLTCGCLHL